MCFEKFVDLTFLVRVAQGYKVSASGSTYQARE